MAMSEYFEIAYAAVSDRLCFFTGTGFSKAVTQNSAPGWEALLDVVCNACRNPEDIKESLFPEDQPNPTSLEEAAQIISIDLLEEGKSIYQEIAKVIEKLELSGDNSSIRDFLSKRKYSVITTNYDYLLEELAGFEDCHSLTPGLPIPRYPARVDTYHVHGSIDVPENMVVTSDDYHQFINNESYFSRKLSTLLHENTVVILGYSLSDTNLKAILSDYRDFSRDHLIGSSVFLVSRSPVSQYLKDYYSYCYGIRVLDNIEIHDFSGY